MFEMGIRPVLILALKAYYANFYIIVNNGRDFAAPFITTYGVKQGGCISPELYKLYSKIIAINISKLKIGAQYGDIRIDVLMYADNIIIVTSCANEAQTMLNEITKISESHEIKFNPDKTNMMIFDKKENDSNLQLLLCGKPIVHSNQIKYLGTEITTNYSNIAHIETRRKKVAISLNNLISSSIINDYMPTSAKMKLFKVYIKPLLTYGCEILDLDENELKSLKQIEGNVVKKLIGIPRRCHTTPLYGALDIESTRNTIMIQQMNFIIRIQKNEYLKKFLIESRKLQNNSGMIGRLLQINGWQKNVNLKKLNKLIMEKQNWFNEKVQQVKKTLEIKNNFLKKNRLNELLHYTTYQAEIVLQSESVEMDEIMVIGPNTPS
jgi:hypothetical protein